MRTIIEGVAYDTETAAFIARGDHGDERSQAWWSLYRTREGAFFEVVAGHDGVIEEIQPLSNKQARAFLERNANSLVEKYFGLMPEARPLRFSRRTVVAAVKMLEKMNQADLSEFLLELGPDFPESVGSEVISMRKRLNNMIALVDQRPDRKLDDGELLRDIIVAKAGEFMPQTGGYAWAGQEPPPLQADAAAFVRALELDGYTIGDGSLTRVLPVDIGLPAAQNEIDRLLEKHGLVIPKGHLSQALDAHARGKWAAANSQIRTFLESLFDEISLKLDPLANTVKSGHPRRTKLAAQGFLNRDLGEWDDKGLGFVNGLIKRLNSEGSHPGLSDDDDCTFRLHVVLLTARLMLSRFDTWGVA
ncbi:MAG: hypothetical protein P4L57_06465 [Rhizomicrobium sp.]|nr:hypothetical protein [Rhizomicrobium sp.]